MWNPVSIQVLLKSRCSRPDMKPFLLRFFWTFWDSASSFRLRIMSSALQLNHAVRVKRAVWRCWQFGMKEAELVLGNWASRHGPGLDSEGLDQLEAVLGRRLRPMPDDCCFWTMTRSRLSPCR